MRRHKRVQGCIGYALMALAACAPAIAANDYHGAPPAASVAGKGAALTTVCAACHGSRGMSVSAQYPNLAGQQYNYILKQLEDFRDGKRSNAIMSGMAMTIPPSAHDADLVAVAAYFASQPLMLHAAVGIPSAELKLGKSIYDHGLQNVSIPACSACHGLAAEGNGPMAVPALAQQHRAYVLAQLQAFASGTRDNSPGHVMRLIARRLDAVQQQALAAYVRQIIPATVLGIGPKTFSTYASQQGIRLPDAKTAEHGDGHHE